MEKIELINLRKATPRTITLFQWLWKSSKGYRHPIFLNGFLGILHVLTGLLFIWCSKRVIDTATGVHDGSIWIEGLYTALTLLFQILLGACETWLTNRIQVNAANNMRHHLFHRILHSRWNTLQQMHTGDIVNRIEQDTQQVVTLLTSSLPTLIVAGVQLLAAFLFFCYLDARLAWTVIGIAPVCLLISKLYVRRMRRFTREIRHSDSRIQSVIQESVQHRTLIKTLEDHPQHLQQLGNLQEILRKQINRRTRFSIFSRTSIAIGFGGGYLTAFLWGSYQLSQHFITFGTMTAFLQLVNQIQSPVYSLSRLIPGIVHTLTSAERLIELEKLPIEEGGDSILLKATPNIQIKNVSFQYHDSRGEKAIFHKLNFFFPAGSSTAILGGSGKNYARTSPIGINLSFRRIYPFRYHGGILHSQSTNPYQFHIRTTGKYTFQR